jgi:hypothetical protein
VYRVKHLYGGIAGYALLATLAHIILNRIPAPAIPRPVYTAAQIAFRAVFVGFIIAVIVLLGKVLTPFWGGIFTMFPAATFASLVIFHYYYSPAQLSYFMKKAPVGSLSLFTYVLSCMWLFPLYGIVWGTLLCYTICLCISLILMHVLARKRA